MLSPLSREASVGMLFTKATHCEKSLEYRGKDASPVPAQHTVGRSANSAPIRGCSGLAGKSAVDRRGNRCGVREYLSPLASAKGISTQLLALPSQRFQSWPIPSAYCGQLRSSSVVAE